MSTDAEASGIQDGAQQSLREAPMELQLLDVQQFHKRTVEAEDSADLNQPRTNQPCRLSSDTPDLSQMQVRHCYSVSPPCKVVCMGRVGVMPYVNIYA